METNPVRAVLEPPEVQAFLLSILRAMAREPDHVAVSIRQSKLWARFDVDVADVDGELVYGKPGDALRVLLSVIGQRSGVHFTLGTAAEQTTATGGRRYGWFTMGAEHGD